MRLALALMLVLGTALGLLIPSGSRPASAPAAASAADPPRDTVLDREPSGHFLAIADVNAMPIRFVVDTGADIVALTEEDATRAHVPFDRSQYQVIGRGAAGDIRGQEVRIESIELDGKRANNVRAVVIEGGNMSLLGHTYLRELKSVSIEGDTMRLR